MKLKNTKHASIGICCPPAKHADFRMSNGKFICNHCEKDFTKEMIEIKEMLEEYFK